MYIVFGSKDNVYQSIPLDGIETVEKYIYKFYGKIKLELCIGKVNDPRSKIKVVDCLQENCINFISAKFFGNFKNIESARNEIKSLTYFGNLKINLVKVDLN